MYNDNLTILSFFLLITFSHFNNHDIIYHHAHQIQNQMNLFPKHTNNDQSENKTNTVNISCPIPVKKFEIAKKSKILVFHRFEKWGKTNTVFSALRNNILRAIQEKKCNTSLIFIFFQKKLKY